MEKVDFVQGERDARRNRVRLTTKGEGLYEDIVPRHETHMAAQFDGLTEEEQRQLVRLLRKLDRNLREKAGDET